MNTNTVAQSDYAANAYTEKRAADNEKVSRYEWKDHWKSTVERKGSEVL